MELPYGFWAGLLAFPILAVCTAAAVIVVIGGWVVLESWGKERFLRLHPTGSDGRTYIDPGRVHHATLFLLAPRAWRFKVGFGCSLLFYRGANKVSRDHAMRVQIALNHVVAEVDR